jgi:ABC-type branched-subunit amino acid transport system permease subunit
MNNLELWQQIISVVLIAEAITLALIVGIVLLFRKRLTLIVSSLISSLAFRLMARSFQDVTKTEQED